MSIHQLVHHLTDRDYEKAVRLNLEAVRLMFAAVESEPDVFPWKRTTDDGTTLVRAAAA